MITNSIKVFTLGPGNQSSKDTEKEAEYILVLGCEEFWVITNYVEPFNLLEVEGTKIHPEGQILGLFSVASMMLKDKAEHNFGL